MRVSFEAWDRSQVASCREDVTLLKSDVRILSVGAKKLLKCSPVGSLKCVTMAPEIHQ
jgi:hypothetical protein